MAMGQISLWVGDSHESPYLNMYQKKTYGRDDCILGVGIDPRWYVPIKQCHDSELPAIFKMLARILGRNTLDV